MKEITDEMSEFCKKHGFTNINQIPSTDLSTIIEDMSNGFQGKTTEDIEIILFSLHAYVLFLKNKRSTLKSYLNRLEQIINQFIAQHTDDVDKYLPFDIKREQIVVMDQKILESHKQSVKCKSHLEKIGDIPFAIDKIIVSIESYLRRRYSN